MCERDRGRLERMRENEKASKKETDRKEKLTERERMSDEREIQRD